MLLVFEDVCTGMVEQNFCPVHIWNSAFMSRVQWFRLLCSVMCGNMNNDCKCSRQRKKRNIFFLVEMDFDCPLLEGGEQGKSETDVGDVCSFEALYWKNQNKENIKYIPLSCSHSIQSINQSINQTCHETVFEVTVGLKICFFFRFSALLVSWFFSFMASSHAWAFLFFINAHTRLQYTC